MNVAPCVLASSKPKSMPRLYDISRDFRGLNAPLVPWSSSLAVYQGDNKKSGARLCWLRDDDVLDDSLLIASNDILDLVAVV